MTVFDDDGAVAFLRAIDGHPHELLYKISLFTGMREGELLGLMWDCVNFEKGTILIDNQLRKGQDKGGKYYFSPPKNNKRRTLTPAPYVMKLLRAQKVHQTEQKLMGGQIQHIGGTLHPDQNGPGTQNTDHCQEHAAVQGEQNRGVDRFAEFLVLMSAEVPGSQNVGADGQS